MDLPENINLEDEKGAEDEDQQDDKETEGNIMLFPTLERSIKRYFRVPTAPRKPFAEKYCTGNL